MTKCDQMLPPGGGVCHQVWPSVPTGKVCLSLRGGAREIEAIEIEFSFVVVLTPCAAPLCVKASSPKNISVKKKQNFDT